MSLRAMYSAISGIQSNNIWLDVVGNNISNVNTTAYKASRLEFADKFCQTLSGAFGGNSTGHTGGINPIQVGLGTRVSSIQTIFDQGPAIATERATDISIQGDGFLLSRWGSQTYLTRAGCLTFDGKGMLVDQNGGVIQGYNAVLQHHPNAVNSYSTIPGRPLIITQALFELDKTSVADIHIDRDVVVPPQATTEIIFKGNLDASQPPNVLNLLPPLGPTLPIGFSIWVNSGGGLNFAIDTARITIQPVATGGFNLQQVDDLSTFVTGVFLPPTPLVNGYINLTFAKIVGGNYAWDQQPPTQPAHQVTQTVYDSLGTPREITIQFYQVNDLGAAVPPVNTPPMSQALYAWYAFDTSGDQKVSTDTLIGGTGIGEGDTGVMASYDRNIPGTGYFGDFIWFNTDGSLAASGGAGGYPGPAGLNFNYMTTPRVYLPPMNWDPPKSPIPSIGAEITPVDLNFGTYGLLGIGKRDGIYCDAEGNYQIVNGVNTYVPKSTAYAASQNGYPDGILREINFNLQGVIQGTFSNGRIIDLAQVVLSQVNNPEGLAKVGSQYYTLSANSGAKRVGEAGGGGLGIIRGYSLEASNVDLTVELTNMILAQRAFEANARMVSVVSSTMDVVNRLGQ